VLQCGLYKSYGQDSCISQGVFKVAPFDGLIFIYQTDPVGYASKRVFLKFIDFMSYTNFIVLRIYAEALDTLRVRLNMYLVYLKIKKKFSGEGHSPFQTLLPLGAQPTGPLDPVSLLTRTLL